MHAFRTAALFVAGATLAFATAYAVSEMTAPVDAEVKARMTLWRGRRDRVQVVTVGNSHSGAIDYAALAAPGFHLWTSGEDLFETVWLTRQVVSEAPRLRLVLMPASYNLEYLDHTVITSADLTGHRREIYLRMTPGRFIPGDLALWVESRLAPVVRPDHWRDPLRRILGPVAPVTRLTADGALLNDEPAPPPTEASMERYGVARAAWQEGIIRETLANDPTVPTRAAALLDTLAADLQARGATLVLFTPPFHAALHRHLPTALADLQATLHPVLARHQNVVWLDFGRDSAFTERVDLFRDADHLNARGAAIFSRRLGDCLRVLAVTHRQEPGDTSCGATDQASGQ